MMSTSDGHSVISIDSIYMYFYNSPDNNHLQIVNNVGWVYTVRFDKSTMVFHFLRLLSFWCVSYTF